MAMTAAETLPPKPICAGRPHPLGMCRHCAVAAVEGADYEASRRAGGFVSGRVRDLVLEHVDTAQNMRRHYAIRVLSEPLFRAFVLHTEWGRIGAKPRTKRESFPSQDALERAWWACVREREAHGYRLKGRAR